MRHVPTFEDEVNPTPDELRAWAYSDAPEPMQDWDTLIAEPGNLPLLLQLVADPTCPSRSYILASLYCFVGHYDRSAPELRDAIALAEQTDVPWLTTWARRARQVIDHPESFNRSDWCGWPGYATRPAGDP
ncbi:hypothetical protein GCM10017774_90140 [Lentzea cavernae]|uniref:Tetratricopeptide repeat-containing protein n=1 Tax=Lentzea cavernae TaxID=2020703 RepID=A0ABQ3N4L2_9PSEU|nr:hypothetical protein GCM10017774_90140 [Lentzea cavernae]